MPMVGVDSGDTIRRLAKQYGFLSQTLYCVRPEHEDVRGRWGGASRKGCPARDCSFPG